MSKTNASEVADRLHQLTQKLYAGSARAFALAIGVSPATLSLVLSGQRPASAKLIDAIRIARPEVSAEWLQFGTGEPLDLRPKMLFDRGCVVPIARRPLAGTPLQRESELTAEFVAVPRAVYGDDVYAIRVSDQIAGAEQSILKGDLLVIDASIMTCSRVDLRRYTGGYVIVIDGVAELRFGPLLSAPESDAEARDQMEIERPRPRAILLDGQSVERKRAASEPRNPQLRGIVRLLLRYFET